MPASPRFRVRSLPTAMAALTSTALLGALLALAPTAGAGTTAAAPPGAGAATAPPGSPVAANGPLEVCGVRLCNSHGTAVQLRGMSTHGTQWYAQCVTDGSLDALATDWRADVLRVSTYVQEDGYETDPRRFTDLVHRIVEQASDRGLYVIVDWHMLSPGDPHHNLERARTFFAEIAERHRDRPNVLYEIANEPNGVGWNRIRDYAEQVVPVIRDRDPDGVVLVGTRAWSSLGVSEGADEQEIVDAPVRADNIMYTFHFYAASHREEYLATLSRAADRLPVFVTEFGTQDYSGEGANDFAMAQRYLDLMEQKKISWVNWNFSDDHRSGAVFRPGTCAADSGWAGTSSLKEAGVWIRDRIRTPDDF
ncbi:glycoside hydrolase family 5 protein [Streptomyces sp. TRM 70361]|uniref:glycoside hydrolase family 5 protein n=1 Tax=Streptomyces sp. TRM 70361 TaxID=3116553 RepID=UPI002E7B9356|nr:glycoside hydrolase family 5 protein [Streptomyces sp. TRM 70361]MEE1940154.1 glycoside hydrolase family 5 protein [Streptomyces sp. TRM 70361]